MKLSKKQKQSLRNYMTSRSRTFRLWSELKTYDIPKGIYQDLQRKYEERAMQAFLSLIKSFGTKKAIELIRQKEAEWRKSGAWRLDVSKKSQPPEPDPIDGSIDALTLQVQILQDKLSEYKKRTENLVSP